MHTVTPKSQTLLTALQAFMERHIYPREEEYKQALASAEDRCATAMDELKAKAASEGLWNLFVPPDHSEYSDLAADLSRICAPCGSYGSGDLVSRSVQLQRPDTGNMEVFMNFGTEAQKAQWLTPLLAGEIRSSYAMTEPQVASSDATNVQLSIRKDGDSWLLNGRKWFITGAPYHR